MTRGWTGKVMGALVWAAVPAARAEPAPATPRVIQETCAACHEVRDGLRGSPRPDAPTFAEIAREHPRYVDGVLLRPPRAMWGVTIRPEDRVAIQAYFAHLRAIEQQLALDR